MAANAPTQQNTMKAIVRDRYGPPDVLELKEIERPALDDDGILVRVRAASINAYDWHMLRGRPSLVRIVAGLRKPKSTAMGVDEVIDYTKEDFTRRGKRYDLILDVAASGSLSSRRRVLEASGILVGVGSADTRYGVMSILGGLVEAAVLSRLGKQKMPFFLAKTSKEDLMVLTELIEAGQVRPIINRRYSLSETAEAMRYLEAAPARAKVVITV